MEARRINISKGLCAICGVELGEHKSSYNKETGTTTDFTHPFDGGTFEDFKFKQTKS